MVFPSFSPLFPTAFFTCSRSCRSSRGPARSRRLTCVSWVFRFYHRNLLGIRVRESYFLLCCETLRLGLSRIDFGSPLVRSLLDTRFLADFGWSFEYILRPQKKGCFQRFSEESNLCLRALCNFFTFFPCVPDGMFTFDLCK